MAPHRLTVRLDDDNAEWVEQRADETGRSKAYVVNEAISDVRGDTRTTPHHDGAHRTGDTRTADADRLDELEARINALESRLSDTTRENGSDSPLSASDSDTMETPREAAPEDGLRAVDADDVRGRVRDTFADRSRMDPDTVDAVATAAAFLADRGGRVATKELKEHTYAEFGEHYSSERSMWNSIDRYLEELPFVEKPGYGKWRFVD